MQMEIQPVIASSGERPVLMAGPCSAESPEQVRAVALDLKSMGVGLFRAGIWKPRTRPDSFEGAGVEGLKWLRELRRETGMQMAVEVANKEHVRQALAHEMDVLWIGARTTVNPFTVQEIADELRGSSVPVIVKNPVNPDTDLWIGAIERLYKAGLRRITAIHRGFSAYGRSAYRNPPQWEIPLELKMRLPGLQVLCDISHICGNREHLPETAQIAMDLQFDGLMVEVHPDPDNALSDARQQITPAALAQLLSTLTIRRTGSENKALQDDLSGLRSRIDRIDRELVQLLGGRMRLAEEIGCVKKANDVSIYQPERWKQVLSQVVRQAGEEGLGEDFIVRVFDAIHQASILHQNKVMNVRLEPHYFLRED